jgi:hypothetical protein
MVDRDTTVGKGYISQREYSGNSKQVFRSMVGGDAGLTE